MPTTMSLDKAIHHGKEHRKGYAQRGKPGTFDLSCRPHGAGRRARPCPWCERNRLHRAARAEASASLRTD